MYPSSNPYIAYSEVVKHQMNPSHRRAMTRLNNLSHLEFSQPKNSSQGHMLLVHLSDKLVKGPFYIALSVLRAELCICQLINECLLI